jgi:hypothetical protein
LANKQNQIAKIRGPVSSNCPAPFSERTDQKIPVVARGSQMPAEIEQIADGSLGSTEHNKSQQVPQISRRALSTYSILIK